MSRASPTYAPRLLPAPEAAACLRVSESTLRGLNIPRKALGAKRLYDRLALDEYASALLDEGEVRAEAENSCDAILRAIR